MAKKIIYVFCWIGIIISLVMFVGVMSNEPTRNVAASIYFLSIILMAITIFILSIIGIYKFHMQEK